MMDVNLLWALEPWVLPLGFGILIAGAWVIIDRMEANRAVPTPGKRYSSEADNRRDLNRHARTRGVTAGPKLAAIVCLAAAAALHVWVTSQIVTHEQDRGAIEGTIVEWMQFAGLSLLFVAAPLLLFLPFALYRTFSRKPGGCSMVFVGVACLILPPATINAMASNSSVDEGYAGQLWWIYTLFMVLLGVATELFRRGRSQGDPPVDNSAAPHLRARQRRRPRYPSDR